MEVRFVPAAWLAIDLYVIHYEDSFTQLFRDSGVWNERMILAGHHDSAATLFRNLYDAIEESFSRGRVLGRQKVGRKLYRLIVTVDDRIIIVHYSQNRKEKTRYIETISIHRA